MTNTADDQDFFARMAEVISQRYNANADKSLWDVYQLDADFLDTGSDADFMIRNRTKILTVLAEPANFEQLLALFINQTIEFTYASNQFVQINAREEAELRRIYANYLHAIQRLLTESSTDAEISTRINTLVAGHFQDLQANITRFFDAEVGGNAQSNIILQKVVCAEYTPELQLQILGIQIEALIQPVLDLGCGKSGNLVRYLNHNGIQALGIDRVVEQSPDLTQADWLDYPMEPEQWGTVISHLGFSNHFLFHHLYQHGSIEPYARQYMAILRSLKPTGSFYYTPGLPFIETYLPREKYRLTRKWIIEDKKLYACKVARND